jgi:hypothetical protein
MDSERKKELIKNIADELQKLDSSGKRIPEDYLENYCRQLATAYDRVVRPWRDSRGRAARDLHDDVARACRMLTNALRHVPISKKRDLLQTAAEDFATLARLDRLEKREMADAREVHIPKARNVFPKGAAAVCAYVLMKDLSTRRPTTTPGGAFQNISSLLYEFFTEEKDTRFDSVCRTICKKKAVHEAGAELSREIAHSENS